MTPPGRHVGIPSAVYYDADALGSTSIRVAARQSVAHYLASRREEPTPAMRMGTYVHAAVLEPERFKRDYVVAVTQQCAGTRRPCGKPVPAGGEHCRAHGGAEEVSAWKAQWEAGNPRRDGETKATLDARRSAALKALPAANCLRVVETECRNRSIPGANTCGIHGGHDTAAVWLASLPAGTEVIASADHEAAVACAEGVWAGLERCGLARAVQAAEHEVSYAAWAILIDEPPGYRLTCKPEERCDRLLVRGRVDVDLGGGAALADLKGTQLRHLATPGAWAWHVVHEGLHIQAALYVALAKAATGHDAGWRWICHEQEAPYSLRIYDADPSLIDLGHLAVAEGLRRWSEYRKNGNPWAGWPTTAEMVWSPLKEE